jgi:AraC-like DNA-binding protein
MVTGKTNRIILEPKWIGFPWITGGGFDSFSVPIPLLSHRHNGYEITYIEKGEVTWVLENGEQLHLSGGDIAVTQPHITHQGEWKVIRPCSLAWIIFEPEKIKADKKGLISKNALFVMEDIFSKAGNCVRRAGKPLAALFQALHEILADRPKHVYDPLLLPLAQSRTLQLIIEVARTLKNQKTTARNMYLNKAIEFINANLETKITITQIASYLGLSESRLFYLFKTYHGQTPADFIQRQRCAKAREMLTGTSKSITTIAFDLGFSSSQYFSTCFKKYTGVEPRKFRNGNGAFSL